MGDAKVPNVHILVAEDVQLWREFISSTLRKESSFEIICEVVDGLEAVLAAEQLQPTIALLDIGLPLLNGIEAARYIRMLAPRTGIIFLSEQHDPEVVQAALDLASGYVLKSDAANDLLAAIHSVARGETFVSGRMAKLGTTGKRENV